MATSFKELLKMRQQQNLKTSTKSDERLKKFVQALEKNKQYRAEMEIKTNKMADITQSGINMVKGIQPTGQSFTPISPRKVTTTSKKTETKKTKKEVEKPKKEVKKIVKKKDSRPYFKQDIDTMTSEEYKGEKLNPVTKFLRYGLGNVPTIGEKKKLAEQYKNPKKVKLDEMSNTKKNLYKGLSPVIKTAQRVLQGAEAERFANTAVATLMGESGFEVAKPSTGNKGIDTAIDIVGTMAGYLSNPGGGISLGGGSNQIYKSAEGGAKKLIGSRFPALAIKGMEKADKVPGLLKGAINSVVEGAGSGVPAALIESGIQNKDLKDTAKYVGRDMLFGGGFNLGLYGLQKAGGKALSKFKPKDVEAPKQADIKQSKKLKITDKNVTAKKVKPRTTELVDFGTEKINTRNAKNIKNTDIDQSIKYSDEITRRKADSAVLETTEKIKSIETTATKIREPEKVNNEILKKFDIDEKGNFIKKKTLTDVVKGKKNSAVLETTEKIKPIETTATKIREPEKVNIAEGKNKIIQEQPRKQFTPYETDKIDRKILDSKEEFDKYYNLDKDIKSINQVEVKNKIVGDIGKRIINKVKSNDLNDIVGYYKNKYQLAHDIEIKPSLRSDNAYARISIPKEGLKPDTKITIKVNPKKPFEIQVGSIRHELEHYMDIANSNFAVKNPKKLMGTMRETYGIGGHHKNYDYFEPDYLRRSMLKELGKDVDNVKVGTGEIKTTAQPETKVTSIKETNVNPVTSNKTMSLDDVNKSVIPDKKTKLSRYKEVTVKNSENTTPEFKEYMKKQPPKEYETVVNKDDWEKAVDTVQNEGTDKVWNRLKNKEALTSQDSTELMALHDHYESIRDYDSANKVLNNLSEKGSKSGQFIQALSIWNKKSTNGFLMEAASNARKGFDNTKLGKKYNTISEQISNLKSTIKKLEMEKASKDEIEYNLKLLSGQEKNLDDVMKKIENAKLSPDLQTKDYEYIKTHMDNYKSDEFYKNAYDTELKKITKGNTVTPKDIAKATARAQRTQLIENVLAMQRIADLEGSTFRDKFRGIQRIMMLHGLGTFMRNNVANTVNGVVEVGVKDNTIAPVLDYIMATVRTKSLIKPILDPAASGRTTLFMPVAKGKYYAKGFLKGVADTGRDLRDSIKYKQWIDTNPARLDIEHAGKRVFKGKIGDTADQIVRRMVSDRPFYQAAYDSRVAELKKLYKTNKVSSSMEDSAKVYALDKTFQNDSYIAKTIGSIKKKIPAMDLIIPFSQTPGNLADKLGDYAVIGSLPKLIKQIGQRKNGNFDTKLFVDTASRMFTGGGLAVLGYKLAENGIITGGLSKSKKIRENELAQGKKAYSIKLGDTYYSYDWLSPVGSILSAAADVYSTSKGKAGWQQILESGAVAAGDSIVNQTMLSGLLDMFSGYSPTSGILQSLLGSSQQVQPSLIKSLARTIDGTERETKDSNVFYTTANRFKSGIPFIRETLPEKVNVYGETVKANQYDNTFKNVLNNFINPTRITKENKSKVSQELQRLYEKTGTSDMLIPVAPDKASSTNKYIKEFDPETLKLKGKKESIEFKTAKEKVDWKKFFGTKQVEEVSSLIDSGAYKNRSDDEKVKMIKSLLRKNSNEIKREYINSKK